LHNLPPGFPHTVVHDTGHWIQLEKPEVVHSIFHEFLKHAGS
jgi:pimeloyl-ACP methyl ester carboxylesterase